MNSIPTHEPVRDRKISEEERRDGGLDELHVALQHDESDVRSELPSARRNRVDGNLRQRHQATGSAFGSKVRNVRAECCPCTSRCSSSSSWRLIDQERGHHAVARIWKFPAHPAGRLRGISRPRSSTVIALFALVIAMGGTSLAGSMLSGSALKNGSVSRHKIATSAQRFAANSVIGTS